MSFAFLPLYTGDYLRDTRHLTPLKHGVYLLLLLHCWDQQGPLPLDEQECAGIANCRSADEVEALRYILARFFVQLEDGWYNKRMQRELERASALSLKRKSAGAKGYQAKAKHLLSKSSASASTLTPTPTLILQPHTEGEALASSPAPQGLSAVVSIPLNDKSEYPIGQKLITEWEKLYPECDVRQTLNEIRGWNLANPSKRKTKAGVLNHINRWLAKEHNRG